MADGVKGRGDPKGDSKLYIFRYALEFVPKSLDLIPEGRKVAMFLRIQFLEGKARRKFFDEHPPKTVYVATSRIKCAMNGDFESTKGSAALYA